MESRDWQDLAVKWAGVRIAHEAMQLENAGRGQREVETLMRLTRHKLFGLDGDIQEPEEMAVHVGENTTIHNHPARDATSGMTSTLLKTALAAALLGGGAGIGAAIPWLAGMMAPDADTLFELELVPDAPPPSAPD